MMALPETGWLGEQNAKLVFWAGMTIALISLLGLAASSILAYTKNKNKIRRHLLFANWQLNYINLKEPPIKFLIPLKKAAEIAYKKTKTEGIARMAERPIGSEKSDPLNLYATGLAGRSDDRVRLFGELPPSKWLREIPRDDAQWGHIKDHGYRLDANKHPERIYENIHITRTDFRRRLKAIKDLG